MELVIPIIILGALVALAMRYGYDSRDTAYSKEREFASLGVTWDVYTMHLDELRREAAMWRLHQQASPPRRGVRRRVAHGLRSLAVRLNPELGTSVASDARIRSG
jgi:hypothetical protein